MAGSYLSVVSFVLYVCFLIYLFVPIAGPLFLYHHPEAPEFTFASQYQELVRANPYPPALKSGVFFQIMNLIYAGFDVPGAALPSSHVAVGLSTVFFSFRYLRPIRYWHLTAAILLCLSTVYCHYHYAVDVLTGALTALLLVPLGNWLFARSMQGRLPIIQPEGLELASPRQR